MAQRQHELKANALPDHQSDGLSMTDLIRCRIILAEAGAWNRLCDLVDAEEDQEESSSVKKGPTSRQILLEMAADSARKGHLKKAKQLLAQPPPWKPCQGIVDAVRNLVVKREDRPEAEAATA